MNVNSAVLEANVDEMSKIPFVVNVIAETLLWLEKPGDESEALELVEMLHDPTFGREAFKRMVRGMRESEEVYCISTKEGIKGGELQTVLVRDGEKTVYIKERFLEKIGP